MRTAGLAGGFVLAVAATVVVFATDDPQVLRLAVVGAAWAFVLPALATSRRMRAPVRDRSAPDGVELAAAERAAAEREAELRPAYPLHLERGTGARREHELRVENDLRRATEQAVRSELQALRAELAQVVELRREMGDVAGLRRDLAGVAELRRDLAQLTELRADVGRLRAELTEQLSGEMLIERIMLRTQSIRTGPGTAESPATRTIDAVGWDEAAPELTAPRPAVQLGDLPGAGGTRQLDEVRAEPDRPAPSVTTPPPPLDWLAERSLLEPPPPPAAAGPRRRRTDDPRPAVEAAPADQVTTERPAARAERPPVPGQPWTAPAEPPAREEGSSRLAEILAESRVSPSSGGRRRRRYQQDGETDDVLSRVLGR